MRSLTCFGAAAAFRFAVRPIFTIASPTAFHSDSGVQNLMQWSLLTLSAVDRYRDLGSLLLRVFFGFVLVYGTQDNVFHGERMLEFRDFLAANGFPEPLTAAYVSAYAQFACGVLMFLGLTTRWAALIMVANFLIALGMVHRELPFSQNIAPLAMLFLSIFFFLDGAGPHSVDARLGAPRGAA